jgi:glycosyltransferase involved in cell wall biosynthesis
MKGIFYLTFNGIFNYTNGIGTQTKLLLDGFDFFKDKLENNYGNIKLNIITPKYNKNFPSYSYYDSKYSKDKIKSVDGNIFFCKNSKRIRDFWTTGYWHSLSRESAEIIKKESVKYNEVLVICIDMPFLQTPIYFYKSNQSNVNIKWVLCPYSSSYIHDKDCLNHKRLEWENTGFLYTKFNENVYIAKVCNFLEEHFINNYKIPKDRFVLYESSLFLQSRDFIKLTKTRIKQILLENKIPLDKKIIFSFGRAVWVKGLDVLINSIPYIKEKVHIVIIAVSPPGEKSEYKNYKRILSFQESSFTFISSFTRLLPQALCQWDNTKIVVCPSRGEPFSNIPLEVSIWAKTHGPVVLASNIEGYLEQIKDAYNGFLFKVGSYKDLANKINYILSIKSNKLEDIKQKAYKKVIKERDFFENFNKTLKEFWTFKK